MLQRSLKESHTQMVQGGRPACRILLWLPDNQCCRTPLVSRQSIKASSSGPAQVKITLPIPRRLQSKHKSRGNRWTQTARLEGSTWQKRKPRNACSADGTAQPFCWDWFCPFLLKHCMKKFTCSMFSIDKAGGKKWITYNHRFWCGQTLAMRKGLRPVQEIPN